MIGSSLISIFINGISGFSSINYFNVSYISMLFGNSVFIFLSHHSVSGIIYPVRPQSKVRHMFLYSFALGGGLLMLEGLLATLAFSWVTNTDRKVFPVEIQELYNLNFLPIPVVSQIVNFYPMLGVSAVPVLIISL